MPLFRLTDDDVQKIAEAVFKRGVPIWRMDTWELDQVRRIVREELARVPESNDARPESAFGI